MSLINPTAGVPFTPTQHRGLSGGFRLFPCHSSLAGMVRREGSVGAFGKAVAMPESSQT